MRRLSLTFITLLLLLFIFGLKPPIPHPHGDDFKISCSVCHSTNGWKIDKSVYSFDHNTAAFALEGTHVETDCKLCHPTLKFSEAENECAACHIDIHQATVGDDCSRCHTPQSWIVQNITQIHYLSRFPLLGAHAVADCYDCHKSETFLRFEPLGIDCIDCHKANYLSTTKPNHATAGFSMNCTECHEISAFEWGSSGFNHNFFPLTQGHDIQECNRCHISGNYSSTSSNCVDCHLSDYNSTTNPNHVASHFSKNCNECHTTKPGWKPATFDHDADFFPIYSGKHNGEWNTCTDCHTNTSSYAIFSCINCHEHSKSNVDNEHDEVKNYSYTSKACFDCHPQGRAD